MQARNRLAVALGIGAVVGGVTGVFTAWQAAVLVAWTTAAAVVLAWNLRIIWPADAAETRQLAARVDDSRATADVTLLTSAVGSLAAVGLVLIKASRAAGIAKAGYVSLAVATVFVSWALVHLVYVLRYADLYYAEGGGVDFNTDSDPDFHDFAYLALTVGMTFQVSDTNISSRAIRRTVTRHALLSYLFGAVVIAMAINIVAGLLNR